MLNYTRIKRLYVKEVLDILRDRRALIAMIVVPIVLTRTRPRSIECDASD